jgi:hypothetical protein
LIRQTGDHGEGEYKKVEVKQNNEKRERVTSEDRRSPSLLTLLWGEIHRGGIIALVALPLIIGKIVHSLSFWIFSSSLFQEDSKQK